jgi:hypothetical protein
MKPIKPIRFKIKKYKVIAYAPHNVVIAYRYTDARNMVEAIDLTKKVKNKLVKQYKPLKWKATKA